MSEIKNKILEIITLAMEISQPDKSQQANGAPHVFVEYAPHVPGLYVNVYLHGWTEPRKPDKQFNIYTSAKANYGDSIDDVYAYLTRLLDEVKQNA